MSVFKNIGIEGYFKRYGLKYAISRGIFMSWPFHYNRDYENNKILYYKKVKKTFEKRYLKFTSQSPDGLEYPFGEKLDNPIWVYWAQGIENAPEIVRQCINSINKYAKSEVIVLTNENLNDYIVMPESIVSKYKKGNISNAAYSDLVRLALLEHYGGTWVDATVYLSAGIDEYVLNSDFFAYRDTFGMIENPALYASWFIHAKPECKIIKAARNMAFAYWENENHAVEYLWVYIFLTIAVEIDDTGVDIPYASSEYSHRLFEELDKKYNTEKWQYLTGLTQVHKLSYKVTEETKNTNNSFYKFICSGEV